MVKATGMVQVQVLPTDSRKWPCPPLIFRCEQLYDTYDLNDVPNQLYFRPPLPSPADVVHAWNELLTLVSESNIRGGHVRRVLTSVFPNFPFSYTRPFDSLAQFLYLAKDICGNWHYDGQQMQIGGKDDIARCYLSRRSIGCGPRHRIVGAMAEAGHHILMPIYTPTGEGRNPGRGVHALFRRLTQLWPEATPELEALMICAVYERAENDLLSAFDLRSNHTALGTVVDVPDAFEAARRLVVDAKRVPNAEIIELLSPYFKRVQLSANFRGATGVYTAEMRSRYLRNLAVLEQSYRQQNNLLTEAERMTEQLKKKGLVQA